MHSRISFSAAVVCAALLCCVVLIQSGCVPKAVPEPQWERDARALLDQADALFAKRQYDAATKTLEGFLYKYPTSRSRDRALFRLGDIRLVLRDFSGAVKYYREVLQEYPASPLILQARYRLGTCYFELKDYDLAIANLSDRSRITDPTQLKRIAEMLAVAYLAKKSYLPAARELATLAETAQTDQQKAGYQERVRELIEKNLTNDDLGSLSAESKYPADLALLRLAGVMLDKRQFKDAISMAKSFLDRFPVHPEKTRAEMIINDATSRMTTARYVIGVLLPITGNFAPFGDQALRGAQLAVHDYNLQNPDDRIEIIVRDTEGLPDKAIAGFKDLASKGVVAVIGPLLSREAEALVPELEKNKLPVVTPAAPGEGIGKLSPWLFRNALTNYGQALAAARYSLDKGLKKFVICYPDDAYGKDLARLFTRELDHKAEILVSISYPSDVKDFGPYIRKLIEIDLRSRKIPIPDDDGERKKLFQVYTPGFDAIYMPGHAERVGLLIPQLAFYNITGVAMIGSNNWHSADLLERAGRHADGSVFTDGFFLESDAPAIKAVVEAYRSAYHEEPDFLSGQAYDAMAMVAALLKQRRDTPLAVRDGLLGLKDFPGISGITTFAGTGEAQKKLFMITVENGKFVLAPGGN
jgi:branched-chain amino acid transport system substrate-binding protein